MQRPSQRLIKQYNLYTKFKSFNINTILNLQQPGEHPHCGDGLLPMVGFSYNPEGFYSQGIKFFNQSWQDMTATTFQHMMRIMNLFYVSIIKQNGKISVHCHAGRGRTLLVICSWLIYYERMSANTTISLAIQKRQGVLTKTSQRQFLKDYQQQLKIRWKSYGPIYRKSFTQFVQLQKQSLLKHEQLACKFKPYLHYHIISQLKTRIEQDASISKSVLMALLNSHSQYFENQWNSQHEQQLKVFKYKVNNHTLFTKQVQLLHNSDIRILTQLLYDFYDGLPFTLISVLALESLTVHSRKMIQQLIVTKLDALLQPQFVHETGVQAISVMLDLVYFLKIVIDGNGGSQAEDRDLYSCLFIRLAILLSGKRKYCPKIFPVKAHHRDCRLLTYSPEKREKYTSVDEIKLATFMQNLASQLKTNDTTELDALITKIRKIDSHLHYYTKNQANSTGGFIKKQQARQIYDKSRLV